MRVTTLPVYSRLARLYGQVVVWFGDRVVALIGGVGVREGTLCLATVL